MLSLYMRDGGRLQQSQGWNGEPLPDGLVWLDLLNPTDSESRTVEKHLAIEIPSREDMEEIELSSRLYNEDGAQFMTLTALVGLDTDDPVRTPITFVVKGHILVTVRYAEPRPFVAFTTRAAKPNALACETGDLVMLGLIEALVDRMADALERIGADVDAISRDVFRSKPTANKSKSRNLEALIGRIGREGDFLTMIQESMVSISRVVTYYVAMDADDIKPPKESRQRVRLIQRDATSLGDHARFLSDKITFLLDATLGLISLEQNQIIKIFSIAAVVFLPPTLVASIYGMNFDHMPELRWLLGYPWALGLMVVSAILPFLLFKRKGWL